MTTLLPNAQAVLVAQIKSSMVKLENPKTLHKLSVAIFCVYAWLLVWLIALKCNMKVTITDTYYLFGEMTWPQKWQFAYDSFVALFKQNYWGNIFLDARQDILNVVVYIPLGLYVSYFFKRNKLLWAFAISFASSACFEMLQLVTHIGCFAAIDLVCNTLGGLLGWCLFKLIYRNKPKHTKVLSVVSIVMLVALVPLALYALIKTATMFDFYLDILLRRY